MNYQLIETGKVIASWTNPRKHFDEHALAELTESVRKHGVLQPILVRAIAGNHDWRVAKGVTLPGERDGYSVVTGGISDTPIMRECGLTKAEAEKRAAVLNAADFELVAGERRWRAATAAGLAEIPAMVRDLTDQETVEIQVIENLQRSDLHPIEEAEGYERLTRDYHYTVDDLAAKVGKSKPYVYGRLKLLALVPKVRQAFEKGDITPSVALLVARVPVSLQEEVLAQCCVDYYGNPAPFRDVKTEIERAYMLRLSEAHWSPKDAELLPAAGPCTTCPKRTGNQPDLFADVSSKDTCTDPSCFKSKREAWGKRELEQAKEQGKTIKPTDQVFNQYGELKNGYVKLDGRCSPLGWESKKTWSQALKNADVEPIITTTKEGEVVKVLPEKEAVEALKETGAKVQSDNGHNRYDAEQRRRAKKKALHQRIAAIAAPKIIEAATRAPGNAPFAALVSRAVYELTDITVHAFVAKRRGLAEKITQAREALEKWLKAPHSASEHEEVAMELLLAARWGSEWEPNFRAEYKKACELASVDLEAIEQDIKTLDQVKEPKAKPASTAPAPAAAPKQPKGKLSPNARARIAAAAKARWAKAKASGRSSQ